jgi:hypothetical protein
MNHTIATIRTEQKEASRMEYSYNGIVLQPTTEQDEGSNHDTANMDNGSTYLAASEPVPVTARNPAAMLVGFQLGTAIRRMRGK